MSFERRLQSWALTDRLREEIRNRSKWWNIRRYPIIVYLSVHGVVNQDGKPCLLLPGDSPLASDKWLPLEKLVEYLFPADAQRALPAKKLLILDCNRMDVNYRLGLLYDSFADGLNDIVKNHPGLAILNSTSPGQIGWTSPEQLHGSVFAYFVQQGLRGTADRRDEGGNGNGKLTLRELHAYVAMRVRQWVLERRADIQEPKLFTEEDDFFLAHAKDAPPTEIPAEKFSDRAEEIRGVHARETALAAADGAANGTDDVDFTHFQLTPENRPDPPGSSGDSKKRGAGSASMPSFPTIASAWRRRAASTCRRARPTQGAPLGRCLRSSPRWRRGR